MFQTLKTIFDIPDLRKKVLYTLMMIAVYRIGAHVTTPFVDSSKVREFFTSVGGEGGGVFGMVDMFTGGAFMQMTVFALGIMPYISAQIILQLLMVVVPKLEKMKKEGEAGQKKIEQITRYSTIILAAFQSLGIAAFLLKSDFVATGMKDHQVLFSFVTMMSMTTGTALLMWIGERITANGIGNGISLLIALGIMAHYPAGVWQMAQDIRLGSMAFIWVPIIIAMCIGVTVLIILMQEGSRKIPIQHARRQVGRKMTMSQTNYLPLKVNTAGVIPVIFSSAILTLPTTLFSWTGAGDAGGNFLGNIGAWISPYSQHNLYEFFHSVFGLQRESIFLLLKVVNVYALLYFVITVFFCFFYTAVMFNPQDVADNLKKAGAFIPGYRPGKQTADYIDMVLTRITTVGALFLVGVALIPQMLMVSFDLRYGVAEFAGGTGLMIVVAVVLDTMKRIESQMLMKHYDGFKIRRQATGGPSGGSQRRWTGRNRTSS
jgi:preprotein translocase subunit SecY